MRKKIEQYCRYLLMSKSRRIILWRSPDRSMRPSSSPRSSTNVNFSARAHADDILTLPIQQRSRIVQQRHPTGYRLPANSLPYGYIRLSSKSWCLISRTRPKQTSSSETQSPTQRHSLLIKASYVEGEYVRRPRYVTSKCVSWIWTHRRLFLATV